MGTDRRSLGTAIYTQNTGISCEAPKFTGLRQLHPFVGRPRDSSASPGSALEFKRGMRPKKASARATTSVIDGARNTSVWSCSHPAVTHSIAVRSHARRHGQLRWHWANGADVRCLRRRASSSVVKPSFSRRDHVLALAELRRRRPPQRPGRTAGALRRSLVPATAWASLARASSIRTFAASDWDMVASL